MILCGLCFLPYEHKKKKKKKSFPEITFSVSALRESVWSVAEETAQVA